ncbi:MAG: thiamine pyrophosphate-dependent enzyme, partial [Candidatus Velthaea sp.]
WGTLNRYPDTLERRPARLAKADAKVVTIALNDVDPHANNQDQQRFYAADVPIIGDVEASLPALLEGVRRALDATARERIAQRAAAVRAAHDGLRQRARAQAAYAWDASPVAVARLVAELGDVLAREDWALVSPQQFVGRWPSRLWNFTKTYQFLGAQGAAGEGYAAPAAVGAALANKRLGRLSVAIQTDGDLMYQPGAYWTAAHHRIPLLAVMHNNRAYHQEVMHVQRIANRRERGITNAHIGTTLADPGIDFAQMIKGLGVWTAGPIAHPGDLRPALVRALAVVKRGEPALIDVQTQPR